MLMAETEKIYAGLKDESLDSNVYREVRTERGTASQEGGKYATTEKGLLGAFLNVSSDAVACSEKIERLRQAQANYDSSESKRAFEIQLLEHEVAQKLQGEGLTYTGWKVALEIAKERGWAVVTREPSEEPEAA